MKHGYVVSLVAVGVLSICPWAAPSGAQTDKRPAVQNPDADVPQVIKQEGKHVRTASNAEGYVILGTRLANALVGEEWMVLEFGATVRRGVPSYILTRGAVSLETPDGTIVPLASVTEYNNAKWDEWHTRELVIKDSIDYFPLDATYACRIDFFPRLPSSGLARDEVELAWPRACKGRLVFHVPGAITSGQYWLTVEFEKSRIRVPFTLLTKGG